MLKFYCTVFMKDENQSICRFFVEAETKSEAYPLAEKIALDFGCKDITWISIKTQEENNGY